MNKDEYVTDLLQRVDVCYSTSKDMNLDQSVIREILAIASGIENYKWIKDLDLLVKDDLWAAIGETMVDNGSNPL